MATVTSADLLGGLVTDIDTLHAIVEKACQELARLNASNRELLSALKAMQEAHAWRSNGFECHCLVCLAARDVIAKAEGH
jgi:hypothetical protein